MPSHRSFAIALAACLLAGWTSHAAAADRPATIPALQEWSASGGEWRLGPDARVIAPCADTGLRGEARLLARGLRGAGRSRVTSLCGSPPRKGDVVIARAASGHPLTEEGYLLRVGRVFRIEASKPAGAFYGGRTLFQLLRAGEPIPRGRARDWPRYPERGLMVDVGRKYFTPGWIKQHIRELAWLKLNYLHLHLSDDQGFRIASRTHPEIVSEKHLTRRDIREILAVAKRHHVIVVPEIDMPGHMEAALAPHPELQLPGEPSVLDVTNFAARHFARDLIKEYLALFGGPYWHTGADEVIPSLTYPLHPRLEAFAEARYGPAANGKDAIHDFVNWVDRLVRRHGKTTRMWHDDVGGGGVLSRFHRIVAEWWIDASPLSDLTPPSPQALIDDGRSILNAGWWPTYYVNGVFGTSALVRPDVRRAYEEWEVHEFQGFLGADDQPDVVAPGEPANLGATLHVWNDNPDLVSEDETAKAIADGLRMLAQKTWSSPPLTTAYAEFADVIEAVGSPPRN